MKQAKQLLLSFILLLGANSLLAQRIAVVGSGSMAAQEEDATAAYNWAMNTYPGDVVYLDFLDIITDPNALQGIQVLWWHYDEDVTLPLITLNPNLGSAINNYRLNGGALILTGLATQVVVDWGIDPCLPGEVGTANPPFTNPDSWGFLMKEPTHPVFAGLTNPFFTLTSPNGEREDSKAWWGLPGVGWYPNQGCDFGGTHLAGTEWDANFDVLMTFGIYEHAADTGHTFVLGAGAYDWHLNNDVNQDSANLQTLTGNMINHLLNISSIGIEDAPAFSMGKVYPMPFNDRLNIGVQVLQYEECSIKILDIMGREVANVFTGPLNPGSYDLTWEATGIPSGVYMYQVQVGDQYEFGRIVKN